jgi:hypothetical protein
LKESIKTGQTFLLGVYCFNSLPPSLSRSDIKKWKRQQTNKMDTHLSNGLCRWKGLIYLETLLLISQIWPLYKKWGVTFHAEYGLRGPWLCVTVSGIRTRGESGKTASNSQFTATFLSC